MPRIPTATHPQSSRLTVFLGSELRRAETRFCARRNGDSSATSRSTRRASSSSSRVELGWEFPAYGGYNSSCKMVEPDFRAISSGQLSPGIAELFHYSGKSRNEIWEKLRDLHRWKLLGHEGVGIGEMVLSRQLSVKKSGEGCFPRPGFQ